MINKKISVSVGIPVYNGRTNIGRLLKTVLSQTGNGFRLKEIIVVSDGSTDGTAVIVKKINNDRVKLLDKKRRQGKAAALKDIFSKFKGDLLFLIDSDVMIPDNKLFSGVVGKFHPQTDGLVSITGEPAPAGNFFESCVNFSVAFKRELGRRWNHGQNILSFRGCFLALSADFARSVNLGKNLINDDTYLYFSALKNGLHPKFLPGLKVIYKSPSGFSDHKKQSDRFRTSKKEMVALFKDKIAREYKIPLSIFIPVSLEFFLKNPVCFTGYLLIYLYSRLKQIRIQGSLWNPALSTKNLNV